MLYKKYKYQNYVLFEKKSIKVGSIKFSQGFVHLSFGRKVFFFFEKGQILNLC